MRAACAGRAQGRPGPVHQHKVVVGGLAHFGASLVAQVAGVKGQQLALGV